MKLLERVELLDFEDCLKPARYTKPDPSIAWTSDGPMLRRFAELAFTNPDGSPLQLDIWQAALLDQILIRYPDNYPNPDLAGRLKYRQVLVSIPRQQGKSLLGALLGLYGLLFHDRARPYVIGIASSREQAQIVYQRVLQVIASNPSLKREFSKLTDTRGIANHDKTRLYELKASKSAAVQGLPITLGIIDEIHITKAELWSACVLGTTTFRDGLVVGITTAGDESSTLLKDLYDRAQGAIEGLNDRFGAWIWEAPTDALTEASVLASNPAVACGRLSLSTVMSDIQSMPATEAIRYRLNRMVVSDNPWLPPEIWSRNRGGSLQTDNAFIAIDKSPNWTEATICAASKKGDIISTEIQDFVVNPTQDILYDKCQRFYNAYPTFIVDNYALKSLGEQLVRDGQTVIFASQQDTIQACMRGYALLSIDKMKYEGSNKMVSALTHEALRGRKKTVGQSWRIVPKDTPISMVMGMLLAGYFADSTQTKEMQLF